MPFDTHKPLTALFEHYSNIPRQATHGKAAAPPPLRYLSHRCAFFNARLGLNPLPSPDTIGGNALKRRLKNSTRARVGINNSCKVTRGLLIVTEAVEPARSMVSSRRSGRRRFDPPPSVAARTGDMQNAVAQETKKDQGRCGQAVL